MNTKITVDGKRAIISGGAPLMPAKVTATDLRAGASMVIGALACNGTTEVDGLNYIDRGYERIVEKLTKLGAEVERIDD